MQKIISLLIILGLVSVAGCAPVAANYPAGKVHADKMLPQKYQHGKMSTRFVWMQADAIHGFLIAADHSSAIVTKMNKYAAMGSQEAVNGAKLFEKMSKLQLAYAANWVFVAKGFEQKIERGDFLLTFTDGSSVQDSGMFLYPLRGSGSTTPTSTRNTLVTLSGDADPKMKGRSMYIFYPAEYLDKRIATIKLPPPKK